MSAAAPELVQITAPVVELPALPQMRVLIPEQLALMLLSATGQLTLQQYVEQKAAQW
jgi:hypothetical protein